MSESNLAEKAAAAADPPPKTDVEPAEGLPGLQRLWDEIFGSILTFCQDAACVDSTCLALATGPVTVERPQQVAT